MRRVFGGRPLGQLLAAALIAAIGVALLVGAVPRLYTAFRASRIAAFACDDDTLRALKPGDWVRLTDCDTDMFHQSGLADGHGQRSHTLLPVREHETSVDEPSDAVLAVTREQMYAGTIRYTFTNVDGEVYGLAETTAVVLGPLDWLPAVHRVHEQIDSGITDGAMVLEARAIPEMQGPGTATAAGTIALLVAVAVGRRR